VAANAARISARELVLQISASLPAAPPHSASLDRSGRACSAIAAPIALSAAAAAADPSQRRRRVASRLSAASRASIVG
jgi:hypothetical protein